MLGVPLESMRVWELRNSFSSGMGPPIPAIEEFHAACSPFEHGHRIRQAILPSLLRSSRGDARRKQHEQLQPHRLEEGAREERESHRLLQHGEAKLPHRPSLPGMPR